MNTQQTKSRSGQPLPDALKGSDVKAALAGYLNDFSTINAELKARISEQENRLTMIESKSTQTYRPALSVQAELDVPHKKAFAAYLRSGDDDAMRALDVEEKGLTTAVAADGGYLVDPATAE